MAKLIGLGKASGDHGDSLTKVSATDILGLGSLWLDQDTGNIYRWVRNVSGGALVATNAVVWDVTDDLGYTVNTTTTANNALLAGVCMGAPADDEYFFICVHGIVLADVDGTTDVAAGAALGTFTTAGSLTGGTPAGKIAALDARATDSVGDVEVMVSCL